MEQAYSPKDDAELWERADAMRWLSLMEWPEMVVAAIMREENPTVETLRRLVYRRGPDEALRVIVRFTFDLEVADACQLDEIQRSERAGQDGEGSCGSR